MAGLPIYSRQGRNGGWQLAGGGRTDLSGLNAAEARALFLVAGPASSATPELRAALRKLVRALPESFRTAAEAATTSVLVDPAGWDQQAPRRTPIHLDAVQQAVVDGEQIVLGYVARDRAATTRVVHPLGLAAKGAVWYLVGDTEAGLAHVSRRPHDVSRAERSARDPTGGVRPAGGVEAHHRGSREQAHADHRDRAGHGGFRADAAMDPRARVSASVPPATTAASRSSCAVTTFVRSPARSPGSGARSRSSILPRCATSSARSAPSSRRRTACSLVRSTYAVARSAVAGGDDARRDRDRVLQGAEVAERLVDLEPAVRECVDDRGPERRRCPAFFCRADRDRRRCLHLLPPISSVGLPSAANVAASCSGRHFSCTEPSAPSDETRARRTRTTSRRATRSAAVGWRTGATPPRSRKRGAGVGARLPTSRTVRPAAPPRRRERRSARRRTPTRSVPGRRCSASSDTPPPSE